MRRGSARGCPSWRFTVVVSFPRVYLYVAYVGISGALTTKRYFDDVAELYTIPRASLISYISRLAGVLYGPGRSFPTSFVVYRALGKSQCADRDTVDQDSKDHDTLVRELSILLGVELPDKKPAADSV